MSMRLGEPHEGRAGTGSERLLFNLWSNPYFHADHNFAAWIEQVYTSDYVITADGLPSFK